MSYIDGPIGPFEIPETPEKTRRVCEDVAREVWAGEYAHPMLPKEAEVVIDIGAGWGVFAVWAMKEWPDAVIHCYEPHDKAWPVPAAQRSQGHCARSSRNDRAVSEAVGRPVRLARQLGCSYGVWRDGRRGRTRGPHPRDLPPCDVLKCDAEGVEPEVLENYPHLADVKAILYEFHNSLHRVQLQEFCRRAGFRCLREVQVGSHNAYLDVGPERLGPPGKRSRPSPRRCTTYWIGPKPPPTAMMDT